MAPEIREPLIDDLTCIGRQRHGCNGSIQASVCHFVTGELLMRRKYPLQHKNVVFIARTMVLTLPIVKLTAARGKVNSVTGHATPTKPRTSVSRVPHQSVSLVNGIFTTRDPGLVEIIEKSTEVQPLSIVSAVQGEQLPPALSILGKSTFPSQMLQDSWLSWSRGSLIPQSDRTAPYILPA
jgi:hypothetical protein